MKRMQQYHDNVMYLLVCVCLQQSVALEQAANEMEQLRKESGLCCFEVQYCKESNLATHNFNMCRDRKPYSTPQISLLTSSTPLRISKQTIE